MRDFIQLHQGNNTITEEPRAESHKPDTLYELVEVMVPFGYKLELFDRAHNARNG